MRIPRAHQFMADAAKWRSFCQFITRKHFQMPKQKLMTPVLLGAAGGAVLTAIIGFTAGGWITHSKAEVMAQDHASQAVVAALAPICVANYHNSSDAALQLVALKKLAAWKYADFVEERGWAKMPGAKNANSAVARACAEMILAAKA